MKHATSLIAVITLAFASTSAFAESCGGCGGKDKDKEKPSSGGNSTQTSQLTSGTTGDKEAE
jgi:hypothetical protein